MARSKVAIRSNNARHYIHCIWLTREIGNEIELSSQSKYTNILYSTCIVQIGFHSSVMCIEVLCGYLKTINNNNTLLIFIVLY